MSSPTISKTNSVELKSVDELLPNSFLVPQYQRGYRWTSQQVNDLLNDLWLFKQNAPSNSFYCLQPIIVKQVGKLWELVDGQQRLTTIYILLRYLNDTYFQKSSRIFSLEYTTRISSQSFLESIDTSRRYENIDYYHISSARDSIEAWFNKQENPALAAIEFYPVLLRRAQFIWYQLNGSTQNEHDVFIRINSGKIPLTNAELVKALFLKKASVGDDANQRQFERRQIEIATEWDSIESKLQNDELWYFLNKENNHQTNRIEFIFSSLAYGHTIGHDEFATFRYFNEILSIASTDEVLNEWLLVKNRFMLFEEWFNNREWYHLIGYLITVGVAINELVSHSSQCTKTHFKEYLIQQIRKKVNQPINDLEYGRNNEALKNVLLLFNVETIRQNHSASNRFPFHQYKGNGDRSRSWSLEHIHAQNDRGLNSSDRYRHWLQDVRRFVEEAAAAPNPALRDDVEDTSSLNTRQLLTDLDTLLIRNEIDKAEFGAIQEKVFALFGEPDLHTLDNLALLMAGDNSSLSNGSFPQKRTRIMALEKEGSFIPIGTRNVFLKYYTPNASHLSYWTENDRDNYLSAIRSTLAIYLP